MKHIWTKEKEDLLYSLYKNKTLDELSEILGLTKDQIKSKGWRSNITFMDYWTQEQDDYLRLNYMNMTYEEIGKVIHRSRSAVQARCRKLGLIKGHSSFKSKLNSDYFAEIDTEEKAYWLGFLSADGCVSYNNTTKSYMFKVTLQRRDSDFLRKFIKAIDGNFNLKLKTARIKCKNEYKEFDTCEVSFRDKKFTSDLLKYFGTNKTEYLRFPDIPDELKRHYIRGFSDGDGCFYCNVEKRDKSFEIIGKCYDMLDDIRKELLRNNITSKIYSKRKTNWKLGIYQLKEIVKFVSYLYEDATIFMKRKYDKSQEILKLASLRETA